MAEIRDYNGKGRWTSESIQRRYESYAKSAGSKNAPLKSIEHEKGSVKWIYPLMHSVIEGIKTGDRACIELGVELVEDGDSMPFGMTLKSSTARSLRQSANLLTIEQQNRIRKRVGDMLIAKYMPREFVEYVKLAKTIGFEMEMSRVNADADRENYWVNHYIERLVQPAEKVTS